MLCDGVEVFGDDGLVSGRKRAVYVGAGRAGVKIEEAARHEGTVAGRRCWLWLAWSGLSATGAGAGCGCRCVACRLFACLCC